jgi:hypothetical protein
VNDAGVAYVVLGYSVALGFLWGYAALVLWQRRMLRRSGGPAEPTDQN